MSGLLEGTCEWYCRPIWDAFSSVGHLFNEVRVRPVTQAQADALAYHLLQTALAFGACMRVDRYGDELMVTMSTRHQKVVAQETGAYLSLILARATARWLIKQEKEGALS